MKKRLKKTRGRVKGREKARCKSEPELNLRPPAHPSHSDPRFEHGEVRVDDVLIRPDHDEVDEGIVTAIAESPGGPFTPIIVRRIPPPEEQPEPGGHKVELIRGRQRLEAARLRGMETIKCIFFKGSLTAARLIALEEELFRKKATALRQAELLVEWADQLRKTGYYISGQLDRKKRGRPPSWTTRALQKLPLVGRSFEARRKEFERKAKIAAIAAEAKSIIVKFRALADNRTALRAIASQKGTEAQVRKAHELAEKAQELRQAAKPKRSGAGGKKPKDHTEEKSPPLQPNAVDEAEESSEADGADEPTARPERPKDTTLEELRDFWKGGGRKLWKYAPASVRSEFSDMLGRASCAAKTSVAEFIKKVCSGRELVYTQELYAFAKKHRISKKPLPLHLRWLGYKLTKSGPHPAAPRAYRSQGSEWKNQLKIITDDELEASVRAEQDLAKQDSDILDELPLDPQEEAYYDDV